MAVVFAVVGYSGVGKTTNILKLITKLKKEGLKVAVIKCSHHNFSINPVGKDTTKFFEHGADLSIFHNDAEFVSIHKFVPVGTIIEDIRNKYDVIIIEGNGDVPCTKINVEVIEKIVETDAENIFEKLKTYV